MARLRARTDRLDARHHSPGKLQQKLRIRIRRDIPDCGPEHCLVEVRRSARAFQYCLRFLVGRRCIEPLRELGKRVRVSEAQRRKRADRRAEITPRLRLRGQVQDVVEGKSSSHSERYGIQARDLLDRTYAFAIEQSRDIGVTPVKFISTSDVSS